MYSIMNDIKKYIFITPKIVPVEYINKPQKKINLSKTKNNINYETLIEMDPQKFYFYINKISDWTYVDANTPVELAINK